MDLLSRSSISDVNFLSVAWRIVIAWRLPYYRRHDIAIPHAKAGKLTSDIELRFRHIRFKDNKIVY